MKRVLLFVLSLFFITIPAWSQYDNPFYEDDSHLIMVPKKSLLIPLGERENQTINDRANGEYTQWDLIPYQKKKGIKMPQDMELPVIGFIKSDIKLPDYDNYIVIYKDALYYLNKNYCPDNSLIDKKNNNIHAYYEKLKENVTVLADRFIYQVTVSAEKASRKAKYYKDNKEHVSDSIAQKNIANKERPMQKKYDSWYQSLDAQAAKTAEIICINKSILGEPNSAAGCDYFFEYTNNSPKTIKYLNWEGTVHNAVNDKVFCEIRNTSSFRGEDVGPVEPNAKGGGRWETIIYNWSAKSFKIASIVITYMDGSKVTISGKDANSVLGAPIRSISQYEKDKIIKEAKENVNAEVYELEKVAGYLNKPELAKHSSGSRLKPQRDIYEQFKNECHKLNAYRDKNSLEPWDAPENVKLLDASVGTL